jgi:hypothetical protein
MAMLRTSPDMSTLTSREPFCPKEAATHRRSQAKLTPSNYSYLSLKKHNK